MEFTMNPYTVYIKLNSDGYITAVNSSAFLPDTSDWTEIDSGHGDKYHHAQGNYFPLPIYTEGGAYRYKLVDGEAVECTAEEITQQEAAMASAETPVTLKSRVETLEEQQSDIAEALEMILNEVTE